MFPWPKPFPKPWPDPWPRPSNNDEIEQLERRVRSLEQDKERLRRELSEVKEELRDATTDSQRKSEIISELRQQLSVNGETNRNLERQVEEEKVGRRQETANIRETQKAENDRNMALKNEDIRCLGRRVEESNVKIRCLEQSLTQQVHEKELARSEAGNLKEQLREKEERCIAKDRIIDKLENDLEICRNRIQTLENEVTEERCGSRIQASATGNMRDKLEEKHERFIEKSQELKEAMATVTSLEEKMQTLKDELVTQKCSDTLKQSEAENLKQQLNNKEKSCKEKEQEIKDLALKLKEAEEQVQNLKDNLTMKQCEGMIAEAKMESVKERLQEAASLRTKTEELQKELMEAKTKLATSLGKLEALELHSKDQREFAREALQLQINLFHDVLDGNCGGSRPRQMIGYQRKGQQQSRRAQPGPRRQDDEEPASLPPNIDVVFCPLASEQKKFREKTQDGQGLNKFLQYMINETPGMSNEFQVGRHQTIFGDIHAAGYSLFVLGGGDRWVEVRCDDDVYSALDSYPGMDQRMTLCIIHDSEKEVGLREALGNN